MYTSKYDLIFSLWEHPLHVSWQDEIAEDSRNLQIEVRGKDVSVFIYTTPEWTQQEVQDAIHKAERSIESYGD